MLEHMHDADADESCLQARVGSVAQPHGLQVAVSPAEPCPSGPILQDGQSLEGGGDRINVGPGPVSTGNTTAATDTSPKKSSQS